jgi:hypothetical protein
MQEFDIVLAGNMLFGLFIAVLVWGEWLRQRLRFPRLGARRGDRLVALLYPAAVFLPLALGLAAQGLSRWPDVWLRLGACFGLGSLWVSLTGEGLAWLGLSYRDDVIERRNRWAGLAIAGGQAGLGLCFALASGRPALAEGNPVLPMQVGLLAGVLSTLALFVFWGLLVRLTDLTEAVTVERDGGAACRLGGALAALGLTVGAAGGAIAVRAEPWRWQTLLGASVALVVAAVVVERCIQVPAEAPQERPRSRDVWIALSYLGAACLCSLLVR